MPAKLKALGEPLLAAILGSIDEGIHAVGPEGITIFYNRVAARLDGLDPQEVVGRHVLEVFPSLTPETSTLLKVLETRRPILHEQQTFTNYKGDRVTTINSTIPIFLGGAFVGALEVSKDITAVRALSEKIIDLQAELLDRRKGRPRSGQPGATYEFKDLVGRDPGFLAVIERARLAARSPSPVLVHGETGTGKELIVHAIHNASPRRHGPFIAQNCAAFPESLLEGILFGTVRGSFTGAEDRPGLFELADGGTLFLDEINSMVPELQAKLLRVLQDGRVRRVGDLRERPLDVRVIASTNIHPLRAIEEGVLRRDLFYRLNAVFLELPALRERRGDLPLLTEHFISNHGVRLNSPVTRVSSEVSRLFEEYNWPGNVRELEHAIEGAMNVADGPEINLDHLSAYLVREPWRKSEEQSVQTGLVRADTGRVYPAQPAVGAAPTKLPGGGLLAKTTFGSNARPSLIEAERQAIQEALEQVGGNISSAARLLGLPRQTLQYRIKTLAIDINRWGGRVPDRVPDRE